MRRPNISLAFEQKQKKKLSLSTNIYIISPHVCSLNEAASFLPVTNQRVCTNEVINLTVFVQHMYCLRNIVRPSRENGGSFLLFFFRTQIIYSDAPSTITPRWRARARVCVWVLVFVLSRLLNGRLSIYSSLHKVATPEPHHESRGPCRV